MNPLRLPTIALACILMALLLTAMFIFASPAHSQQTPQIPCMPGAALEKQIKDQYGESTIGAGLNPSGAIYLMANPETGTFTVLLLRQDGIACVISGGKGWVSLPPTIPGTDL